MANNIGGLFKELGKNECIQQYISDGIKSKKMTTEIVEQIMNDSTIMVVLKSFVENENTIIEKVKTVVGQQMKKMNTIVEKPFLENKAISISTDLAESDEEPVYEIQPCVPPLSKNPTWLFPGCYMERLENDHRIHLVTSQHECYY
jgi:hypothetical protein